jgi:hypothetical protein
MADDIPPTTIMANLSLNQSPIVHPARMTIRVYDVDEESSASSTTGTSDTDGIADDQSDIDVEISTPIELVIEQHKQAFIRFLAAKSTTHRPRMESASSDLHTILKPSASSIKYPVMHPLTCRHMKPILDLDHFAELVHAPTNWRSLFEDAWDDSCKILYRGFVGLPVDTVESNIFVAFALVVSQLSRNLSINTTPVDQTKVRVGGVTAIPDYDYASVTDVKLVGTITRQTLFSTEVKTPSSWKLRESWYRDSRLAQVLTALYGHGAPTFLFTQQQFKVFCENSQRNTIFTFPFDIDPNESAETNSFMCYKMHVLFFQAVAICLLREPRAAVSSSDELTATAVEPVKPTAKHSPEKKHTLAKKKAAESQKSVKAPSFISGFKKDGAPVYQAVTVWDIDEEEGEMGSSTTLVEV